MRMLGMCILGEGLCDSAYLYSIGLGVLGVLLYIQYIHVARTSLARAKLHAGPIMVQGSRTGKPLGIGKLLASACNYTGWIIDAQRH